MSNRKSYFQISERIKQLCNKEDRRIRFIDCLTIMFCSDDTKNKSLVGGTARAHELYFKGDGLHFSIEGYIRWKEELDLLLSKIVEGQTLFENCIFLLKNHDHFNESIIMYLSEITHKL